MGTFVHCDSNGLNGTSIPSITWGTAAAATQNLDLAIMPWVFLNTETPTDPTSEAWSLAVSNVSQDCEGRILYRVCDGTESGDITGWSTTGAGNRQAAVLLVLRGYQFISGFKIRNETVNSTSHECPQLLATDGFNGNFPANGDTILVFTFDRAASTGATPPTGWTARTGGVFAATGTGGTIVGVADDSLTDSATIPSDPGPWTGQALSDDNFTVTMSLRPSGGSGANQGALAASFAAAVASINGDASSSADLLASFSSVVAAATGSATAGGALSGGFSSPTTALSGSSSIESVLTGSFSGPLVDIDTTVSLSAELTGSFSGPTADIDATVSLGGDLAGAFSGVDFQAQASGSASALLSAAFSAVQTQFTGQSVDEVNRGTISGSFAAVELSADGSGLGSGQVVGAFSVPAVQISGDASAQGTLVGTFSAATISLEGSISGIPRDVEVVILSIAEAGVEISPSADPISTVIVKSTAVFTTIGGIDVRDQWRKGSKEFIDFVATIRDRTGDMTLAEAQALGYKIAVTKGEEPNPDDPTNVAFVVPSTAPEVVQDEENGVPIPGQFSVTIRHLYEANVTGLHKVWLTFGPTPEEPILLAVTFVAL